jgi:hypothetical protein
MQKEGAARIKINKLLEQAGWRLIGDDRGPANVVLENHIKITKSSLDAYGDDINKTIHERAASRKHDIVKNLGKSCAVIDNGYEEISRYSRMLQIADFVVYSYHNYCCLNQCSTLFEQKTDERKLAMFKGFFRTTLKAKYTIVHLAT